MRVDVYSRHDAYVGTMGPEDLLGFVHTDELNGEDSVKVTTTFQLAEGMRLVWRDGRGGAHEHVCQDPKGLNEGGRTVYTDTALNSICELFGDYVVDKRPYGYSFANALQVALEPTRWAMGAVDQPGTVSSGLTFYHQSARECVNDILECGGELETSVTVGAGGVTARKVGIRRHRGETGGHRRFASGKDLLSASRTEHWGAITACYGYGKGVETDSGGYGRKLTFGDVNGGKDYVEDADALKAYGRPDGKGGLAHVFGAYENEKCADAKQLLAETKAYLEEHRVPGVTYSVDVVDLVAMGRQWEGVGVGDDVQIVDEHFSPVLRCEGRVTKMVTDCLAGTCEVTLGNVQESFADMFAQQQQAVSSLSKRSSSWDVAASTPAAYLQQILSGLNERFNASGMSYVHTSFEHGIIVASVPLDGDGLPTTTPASGMQLCSQGFRIASTTKADGSFDWQTFGTGEGFFANMLVAGVLDAGLVKAGVLQDAAGKNFINMETGDCRLAATATVGGKGIATADAVGRVNDAVTALAEDGVVTEAERAAVAKVLQGLERERGELAAEYATLAKSAAASMRGWSSQYPSMPFGTRLSADYKAVFDSGKAYDALASAIGSVTAAGDASTLSTAMGAYEKAYSAYGDALGAYLDDVRTADDLNAQAKVSTLDKSLDQAEVFNRLTNNGATQGVYMQNGKLYINATYIRSGTLNASYVRGGTLQGVELVSGSDTSHKVATSSGRVKFYYNGNETIELVSIPAYKSGKRGGYLQACDGATYLGLRAPHLYTAEDTSEAGTIGYTGTQPCSYYDLDSDGYVGGHCRYRLKFINGICVGSVDW